MRQIKDMKCQCGSNHVTFTIEEYDGKGTSDFDCDLISVYGNPFGAYKGNQIDIEQLKKYILETYSENKCRMFLYDFAYSTCFGKCEDETTSIIEFEDGTIFEYDNDNRPDLYSFREYTSPEERALLYLCEISNEDILKVLPK